jgi:hypothetical protein
VVDQRGLRHFWLIALVVLGWPGCGAAMRRTAELPRCRVARAAPRHDCAAPSVSGTVVAATREPIAGVEVLVGDEPSQTTTGPDGAFELCGLAASPVGRRLTLRHRGDSATAILSDATAVVSAEVREERWSRYVDPSVRRPKRAPDRVVWRLALCTP